MAGRVKMTVTDPESINGGTLTASRRIKRIGRRIERTGYSTDNSNGRASD